MKIIQYAFIHLQRMLKNKKILIMGMIMPTIVVTLVAFVTRGTVNTNKTTMNVDVVNNDKGDIGQSLIKELEDVGNFAVNEISLEDGERRVKKNVVAFAIVIPENFTESIEGENKDIVPEVKILKINQGNSDNLVRSRINTFISRNISAKKIASVIKDKNYVLNTSSEELEETLITDMQTEKVNVDVSTFTKEKSGNSMNTLLLGVLISFMMYTMINFVNEIMELKNNGTLRRSLSTPNNNITIGASLVLSFLLIGWMQVLLMLGFTKFVVKVSWGSSFISLFLLFTSLLLVILSLGFLLTRWIKTETQSAVIVNMVVTVTCMLSGCFAPLDYLPNIFQKISNFTPQSWALTGLTELVVKNNGLLSILPSIGILLLFAAAFFTAGAASLRTITQN